VGKKKLAGFTALIAVFPASKRERFLHANAILITKVFVNLVKELLAVRRNGVCHRR
jgi:hypothetical protein